MIEFFQKTYYGNTIGEWLIAFSLILASVIVSRILFWIISRGFRLLTRKTRTQLDDIIINQIEEPIVAALLVFGIRLSVNTLTISEGAKMWLESVFSFSFTLIVAWLITRLYISLHEQYLVPLSQKSHTDVDDMLLPVLKSGIRTIVWTIAIIVGLNNAGYNVGAILAGLGLGGLAFALAAQDVVANFFGGITIFVQRPFTIGDEVIILDPSKKKINGYIRKIGIRTTFVEGKYGSTYSIPNSTFSKHSIEKIEYSRTKFRIVRKLHLSHATKPEQVESVIAIIDEAARTNDQVKNESIYIRFDDITDYSTVIDYQYEIKEWQDVDIKFFRNPKAKAFQVTTQMNLEILKKLKLNGIELAIPILLKDLHLSK